MSIDALCAEARDRLRDILYGEDGDTMESVVGRLLGERQLTARRRRILYGRVDRPSAHAGVRLIGLPGPSRRDVQQSREGRHAGCANGSDRPAWGRQRGSGCSHGQRSS